MTNKHSIDFGYQNLANEIVRLAFVDYKKLLDHPPKTDDPAVIGRYKKSKRDLMNFFHSRWYKTLTNINPDYVLENINDVRIARSSMEY